MRWYLFVFMGLLGCTPVKYSFDDTLRYQARGYQIVYNNQEVSAGNLLLDKENVRKVKKDIIGRRVNIYPKQENVLFKNGAAFVKEICDTMGQEFEVVVLNGVPLWPEILRDMQIEQTAKFNYNVLIPDSSGNWPSCHSYNKPVLIIVSR